MEREISRLSPLLGMDCEGGVESKMAKWVIVLLFAMSAFGQEQPKLAELSVFPEFLFADGVWRADNLNEKTELAFDAVTHLECYKHGGKDLVGTDAYCA